MWSWNVSSEPWFGQNIIVLLSQYECMAAHLCSRGLGSQIEPKDVIRCNSGRFKRIWNWPPRNLISMRTQGGSCQRLYSKAVVITSESPGELKKPSLCLRCISDQLIRTSEGGTWPGIQLPRVILCTAKMENCSSRGWEHRDNTGLSQGYWQMKQGKRGSGYNMFLSIKLPLDSAPRESYPWLSLDCHTWD